MDSINANIFLAIQERIEQEAKAIKWIDQDYGQMEFYDKALNRPALLFPCVLIDIADADYTDNSVKSQIATGVLEIRLGVTAYVPSAHVHPRERKEAAIAYHNLEHLVNKALHGWCDSRFFSPLMRKKAVTEKREDNLRVRSIRYEFSFMDDTAMDVPFQTIDRPDMETEGYLGMSQE